MRIVWWVHNAVEAACFHNQEDKMGTQIESGGWLRTSAAAKHTGLSASTLAKMRVYGTGPVFAKAGRTVVYARAELDRWLMARLCSKTSEGIPEGD